MAGRFRLQSVGLLCILWFGLFLLAACQNTPADSPAEGEAQSPEPADEAELSSSSAEPAYLNPELPIDTRVDDLLARMTLADKIGQMTLVEKDSILPAQLLDYGLGGILSGGGGSPRINDAENWVLMVDDFQAHALQRELPIPLLYGVDAVHGHNNLFGATIFPHNIGLGAAHNPELMVAIGRATAQEMIATGIYWNYAPAVSVPQDIRWGRTYEGYSEDTALVSELATAYLIGLQGNGLAAPDTVLATPKHFVGDGGTVWGSATTNGYRIDQGVTDVDEETLRRIHLPPYEAMIDNGARAIMISYSSWGDSRMHAQRYLITDVLRGELGFDGFIVSDWAAVDQIDPDYAVAVVTAVNAGIDMVMVPYNYARFIDTLTQAVAAGDVAEARIDEAVRRILTVKFELGLFEQPYANPDLMATVGSAEHRALAREAVAQSQVLLRNEGSILPLAADLPRLFVGGRAADDIGIQSGGWTIEWQGQSGAITPGTTILQGIEATVSPDTQVVYDTLGQFADSLDMEPVTCIAVVGERPYAEGRGDSRGLRLPAEDQRLLEQMAGNCADLVVVLISGRPLIITELLGAWDALVAAWLPGSEGQGVADVLFGLKPFTGTLPYTWPQASDQLPLNMHSAAGEPLFPLGYGMQTEPVD
ncbi:MAG: glycoside hydrolase family 3 C-terminal domain-containing protein [Anaerolineales bacterium]|nr:glycoside hydrolase family 3 C-terminal domain-containing protein [Anaerolineales bacterium]